LKNELLDYREKVEPKASARDSYEVWREGRHDDLVLAVSMGAWFREWWNKHTDTALARRRRRTNQAMVY
jgi:hypothetical protein